MSWHKEEFLVKKTKAVRPEQVAGETLDAQGAVNTVTFQKAKGPVAGTNSDRTDKSSKSKERQKVRKI